MKSTPLCQVYKPTPTPSFSITNNENLLPNIAIFYPHFVRILILWLIIPKMPREFICTLCRSEKVYTRFTRLREHALDKHEQDLEKGPGGKIMPLPASADDVRRVKESIARDQAKRRAAAKAKKLESARGKKTKGLLIKNPRSRKQDTAVQAAPPQQDAATQTMPEQQDAATQTMSLPEPLDPFTCHAPGTSSSTAPTEPQSVVMPADITVDLQLLTDEEEADLLGDLQEIFDWGRPLAPSP
jgi:hypothetical protein